MKNILITMVAASIFSAVANAQKLSHGALCKKWYLEKYEVMWVDYEPEEKEKNDYILLNKNMSYQAVSEGEFSEGKWSFNDEENYFILYDENNEGLKFIVETLKKDRLVVVIDIKELKDIDIHYINK